MFESQKNSWYFMKVSNLCRYQLSLNLIAAELQSQGFFTEKCGTWRTEGWRHEEAAAAVVITLTSNVIGSNEHSLRGEEAERMAEILTARFEVLSLWRDQRKIRSDMWPEISNEIYALIQRLRAMSVIP